MSGLVPAAEAVRDFVWTLPLRHPDARIGYTISYIVRDENAALHVIDPGWSSDENWRSLTAELTRLGGDVAEVASITVTHLHSDHLGLAGRLKAASGAPVLMHRVEQSCLDRMLSMETERLAARELELENWGVPPERRPELLAAMMAGNRLSSGADVLLDDSDILDIPGQSFEVIRTPGHTPGHICLRNADAKLIFTGDHVLPTVYPGLGLGGTTETNPIRDYLEAVHALVAFDDHEVCPGHEYRFIGLAQRCEAIVAHHLRRATEVAALTRELPGADVWQVASHVRWSAGWHGMHGFFLYSALAQTAMHIDFVESGSYGSLADRRGSGQPKVTACA